MRGVGLLPAHEGRGCLLMLETWGLEGELQVPCLLCFADGSLGCDLPQPFRDDLLEGKEPHPVSPPRQVCSSQLCVNFSETFMHFLDWKSVSAKWVSYRKGPGQNSSLPGSFCPMVWLLPLSWS